MYRDITSVEREMCDYTGNKWSHRSSNKRFKEKYRSHNSKTFSRFTTTDSCTCNMTHNTESTAVWNSKRLGEVSGTKDLCQET